MDSVATQSSQIQKTNTSRQKNSDYTWATLCHAASFSGAVIPFGSIVGPLIIWLIKKDTDPFVDEQGKEVLNFQISIFIYFLISIVLMLVVVGFLLLGIVALLSFIFTIVAIVKTSQGAHYRYPLTLRFIK